MIQGKNHQGNEGNMNLETNTKLPGIPVAWKKDIMTITAIFRTLLITLRTFSAPPSYVTPQPAGSSLAWVWPCILSKHLEVTCLWPQGSRRRAGQGVFTSVQVPRPGYTLHISLPSQRPAVGTPKGKYHFSSVKTLRRKVDAPCSRRARSHWAEHLVFLQGEGEGRGAGAPPRPVPPGPAP